MNRRQFIGSTLAATATGTLLGTLRSQAAEDKPSLPAPSDFKRKIKLGVVGLGGRGKWITGLFRKHGGYEIHAVADYFQKVADVAGDEFGVDAARRFSGLSGYKKLIESGVEAIAIEDIPYFYPEQARAAVEAGLHVYIAKPVAVDVPGALSIGDSGKLATRKQRVFLVDYQMPTDPAMIEAAQRIRDEALGKLAQVQTVGICAGFGDPPKEATIENRMQGLRWVPEVALGCGYIGNFDIHAIDAALWVIGERPVLAQGSSRICRPNPHGDSDDVTAVVYEYADGLVHSHFGQALKNNNDVALQASFHGTAANAQLNYWGKVFIRGGTKHYGGKSENLYEAGAVRNIAAFYKDITEGRFENSTVPRAVDGVLTCVLGREAGIRHGKLTMAELLKENKKLEVDLRGLKA